MTINPGDASPVPQPAEVSPTAIQALWDETNALTADLADYPAVGRFGTFPAVIDGGPVELVVMVHPTQQAEDGSIGSISVCPEGSNDDTDATHYQFRFEHEGMTLGKLLPVDFSRAGLMSLCLCRVLNIVSGWDAERQPGMLLKWHSAPSMSGTV
jgi:hypothetical protein